MTVCVHNRQRLLGDINVGAGPCAGPVMELTPIGEMVQRIWNEIPQYYPGVDIDEFTVMPNHIHGIIVLTGRPQGAAPTGLTLSDVVQRFKSLTTRRYWQYQTPSSPKKLWQRNYFERIIRTDHELYQIRQYIQFNPEMWEDDENNV